MIKLLLALEGALLVWIFLIATEWLPNSTPQATAAQRLLLDENATIPGARDAFVAFWMLDVDAPESEWDDLTQDDVTRSSEGLRMELDQVSFEPSGKTLYGALALPSQDDPALCELRAFDCLDRVRNHLPQAHELAEASRELIARTDRLARFDHLVNGFSPALDAPIALRGTAFQLQLTAIAVDFLAGRIEPAFSRLCSTTSVWRQLRANTDSLVHSIYGVSMLSAAIHLHAQMLAELPADFEIPCADAFAPLADAELDLCPVMRREYRDMLGSFSLFKSGVKMTSSVRLNRWVDQFRHLINDRRLREHVAERFAIYCQRQQTERARMRSPEPAASFPGCKIDALVFDPIGCYFRNRLELDYERYYRRVLDLDARLRLFQASLWLRDQVDPVDFDARPAHARSAHHAMELRENLSVQMLDHAYGETWTIPVAPRTSGNRADASDP